MNIDSSKELRFVPDKTGEYLKYHHSHILNFNPTQDSDIFTNIIGGIV